MLGWWPRWRRARPEAKRVSLGRRRSRRWSLRVWSQVRRSRASRPVSLGQMAMLAAVGYPEATMAVRAFLPKGMFVTGASPMTLTRASRRESRQNPGEGASMPVRVLGGAGLVLKPRIARSWAGTGVDVKGRKVFIWSLLFPHPLRVGSESSSSYPHSQGRAAIFPARVWSMKRAA